MFNTWDCFHEKGRNTFFSRFHVLHIHSSALKCPLHIASYTLRIRVSVVNL